MVKKALCCGLNYPSHSHKLFGCVNDCLDWEHLLREQFRFDETRVLLDQHPDGKPATAPTQIPTRANILAQLGWLCSGVEPGDCLVFMFAGHGCQVRGAHGRTEEALVPEDFVEGAPDSPLVFEDELHALFQRLPSGSFLTVILDACHASTMLDVPCSVDTSTRPAQKLTTCERPREVARTEASWEKAKIQHAQARPRFMPEVSASAQRQRRTPESSGAALGRMTLDPGVTAFCFAASRTQETALDANIRKHQRGVMSFCLLEALQVLRYRCTYEMMLEEACKIAQDIREKYMPSMDQHIVLTYCPNSTPSEVVVLDEQYATVAQHRLSQQQPQDPTGADFVPTPQHQQQQQPTMDTRPPQASPQASPMRLFLIVHTAYHLGSVASGPCDTVVVTRVGRDEHRTSTLGGTLEPLWERDNKFTFPVHSEDARLELEVRNALKNEVLGRTSVDLKKLPLATWDRQTVRLQDQRGQPAGEAELCFDVRLELLQRPGGSTDRQSESQPARSGRGDSGAGSHRAASPMAQQRPPQQPQQQPPQQPPQQQQPAPQPRTQEPRGEPVEAQRPAGAALAGSGAARGSGGPPAAPVPDLFGMPNLLGAMPNLLSNIAGGAPPTMPLGTGGMGGAGGMGGRPCMGGFGGLPGAGGFGMPEGVYSSHGLPHEPGAGAYAAAPGGVGAAAYSASPGSVATPVMYAAQHGLQAPSSPYAVSAAPTSGYVGGYDGLYGGGAAAAPAAGYDLAYAGMPYAPSGMVPYTPYPQGRRLY